MNKVVFTTFFIILVVLCSFTIKSLAQKSTKNQLEDEFEHSFTIDTMKFTFKGAFRFPNSKLGDSKITYSSGAFTLGKFNKSLFISGHTRTNGIAEFHIPTLTQQVELEKLSYANPLQHFKNFLTQKLNNHQNLNRITGMDFIENELFVNAIEYYDAPADNTESTFIIRQPESLTTSAVDGFYNFNKAAHTAGWISKIPNEYQSILAGSYMIGNASNYPINARLSIGPSAFSSYLDSFAGIKVTKGLIPTTELMNFSLNNKLHNDYYNESRKNDLWTINSKAVYGFIVPNTEFYLVIGHSGGHVGGIGYKATQDNGNQCGGPCALIHDDYYNYYWLFNTKDLIRVKNKISKPYEVIPIKYGKILTAIEIDNNFSKIIGADFDFNNHLLYLLMGDADKSQSKYESVPVMIVYQLSI